MGKNNKESEETKSNKESFVDADLLYICRIILNFFVMIFDIAIRYSRMPWSYRGTMIMWMGSMCADLLILSFIVALSEFKNGARITIDLSYCSQTV